MCRCFIARRPMSLRRTLALISPIGSWLLACAAFGELSSAPSTSTTADLVQAFITGSPGQKALLESALERSPDDMAIRGLAGFLGIQDRWSPIDVAAAALAADGRCKEYYTRRSSVPDTAAGNRTMAAWCAHRGLKDRERAHLTRLLEFTPDDGPARDGLGFVSDNGIWVSKAEVYENTRRAIRNAKALAEWQPKLLAIRRGWQASTGLRQDSRDQWNEIDDPAAIPAMELVFSADADPSFAKMVVNKLSRWDCPEAAVSLARHAVLLENAEVRKAAAESLKTRPCEQYVPILLGNLCTPASSQAGLFLAADGRLLLRRVSTREGQDQQQATVVDTFYRSAATNAADNREALRKRSAGRSVSRPGPRQACLGRTSPALP